MAVQLQLHRPLHLHPALITADREQEAEQTVIHFLLQEQVDPKKVNKPGDTRFEPLAPSLS